VAQIVEVWYDEWLEGFDVVAEADTVAELAEVGRDVVEPVTVAVTEILVELW